MNRWNFRKKETEAESSEREERKKEQEELKKEQRKWTRNGKAEVDIAT
jgi:hypothetical protein